MTLRATLAPFDPHCSEATTSQGCEESHCEAFLHIVPPGATEPTRLSDNTVSPYLLLEAAGTTFPQPLDTSAAPVAPVPVHTFKCVGSVGSTCCELELSPNTGTSDVIVTGIVHDQTIFVGDICKTGESAREP